MVHKRDLSSAWIRKKNKRKFREQIHIEFVRLVFCFSRLQFFFVRSSVSLRFSPRLPSSLLRRLNSHTNRLTIYYYFVTLSTVEPCLLFLFRFSPFPIFSDFSQLKGAYCNHDYHNSSLGDLWYKFNDAVNSWEYSFSGRSVMLVLFQSILWQLVRGFKSYTALKSFVLTFNPVSVKCKISHLKINTAQVWLIFKSLLCSLYCDWSIYP